LADTARDRKEGKKMPTYPRYLTYRQGELEARLRELGKAGRGSVALLTRVGQERRDIAGRGRLRKSHSCPVSFPDGQEGTCSYTRGGPAWHLFRYDHGGTTLPVQHLTERIGNDLASIEAAARRLAEAAYAQAILRERREYFQRATETGGRKKHPERFQMKAARAKALSGRYAVCRRVGDNLLPVGRTHDVLEEANAEWRERRDPRLVVACLNRLDRCWEMPRFNPLYGQCPPQAESDLASVDEDWEHLPGPDESEDEDLGDQEVEP
jgi:hypothetical protein